MEFGIFSNGFRPHTTASQTYEEDLQEIILADQLGFRDAYISEHHGEPVYINKVDTLPVPELLMCKAAGTDQADSDGCGRQAHPPGASGRYCHPGGGHRSRDGQRPLHLRIRLGISQSAVRERTRPVARRPSPAAARIARLHPEMLDVGRTFRLGRQVLARQEHCRHAAAVAPAAHADGNRDRHGRHDRPRRIARLYAALGAARTSTVHPKEGRSLRARRAGRGPQVAASQHHRRPLRLPGRLPPGGDGRSTPRHHVRTRLPDQARPHQNPQVELQLAIRGRRGLVRPARRRGRLLSGRSGRGRSSAPGVLRSLRRVRDAAARHRQGLGNA